MGFKLSLLLRHVVGIYACLTDVLYCLLYVHSFLNDIDRIATKNYRPSDDDVVRARLRTLGVQEHRFVFEEGAHTYMIMQRVYD